MGCRWLGCGVAFVVGLFDGLGRFWKFKRSKAVQCRQSLGGDPPACIGMSGVGYPGLVLLGVACSGFALSDHA